MAHIYAGEYTGDYNELLYLRARFYAPGMGRFLAQDTWNGDPYRPMSLNRWNYGEGNPVHYTDPTGHYIFEGGACFVGIDCDPTASSYTGQSLRNAVLGADGYIYDKGLWTTVSTVLLSPKDTERIYGVAVPMRITWSTLVDPTNEGYYMCWMGFGGTLAMAGSKMPNWFGRGFIDNTVPAKLVDDVYPQLAFDPAGRLPNAEVRRWYNLRLREIDTNGPRTEEFARQVHDQRNALKAKARELMLNRAEAAMLDRNFPLHDFEYYVQKYTAQGYTGEALWDRIIQGGVTPNPDVNRRFRISP